MSNLRERAAEIRKAGTDRREKWSPTIGGVSYRIYKWWIHKTGKTIERENFCHYWRVVAIWAPLLKLRKPLQALGWLLLGLVVLAVFAYGLWLAAQHLPVVAAICVMVVSAAYLVLGFRVFLQLVYDVAEKDSSFKWKWLDSKGYVVKAALVFVTMPVCLTLAVVVISIGSIGTVLVGLGAKYDLYWKMLGWFGEAHFTERRPFNWLRPWLLVPAIVAAVYYWEPEARNFIFGALVVVVVLMVIVGAVMLLAVLRDANQLRVASKPRPVSSSKTSGAEEYQPGRVRQSMSAIGNLLDLIWAAILAWKWGICPLVEFPTEEVSLTKQPE